MEARCSSEMLVSTKTPHGFTTQTSNVILAAMRTSIPHTLVYSFTKKLSVLWIDAPNKGNGGDWTTKPKNFGKWLPTSSKCLPEFLAYTKSYSSTTYRKFFQQRKRWRWNAVVFFFLSWDCFASFPSFKSKTNHARSVYSHLGCGLSTPVVARPPVVFCWLVRTTYFSDSRGSCWLVRALLVDYGLVETFLQNKNVHTAYSRLSDTFSRG